MWQPPADVVSGAIACLFRQGGIPSPTRHKYSGTLHALSYVLPYYHLSVIPSYLPPFAVLHRPLLPFISAASPHAATVSIVPEYLPPTVAVVVVILWSASASICLLPPLPSSSKPSRFSLLTRYLSYFTACLSPSYLYHPSISASLQFDPPLKYVITTTLPPYSLSISLLSISIYLSIYLSISSHSLSLSYLSHSLSVSLHFYSTS